MNKVYILGGGRSPIGMKNGQFKRIVPEKIGAIVLKELVKRYELTEIDEIIAGNVVGSGGNLARLMALYAGICEEVPAYTIDMQCASGSASLDLAYQKIKSGQCDLIVAGGFESTSLQPYRQFQTTDPRFNEFSAPFIVSQFSPNEVGESAMLAGAERVAQAEGMSKDELDTWVKRSHEKACQAKQNKSLESLIIPIERMTDDEGIRERMNQRLLDRLSPLIRKDGLINSANACLMHDGAAFIILCSENYLKKTTKKPIAKLIGSRLIGGNPLTSPQLAIQAIDALLAHFDLDANQIQAFEVNEAFAVIDVLFERTYPSCVSRYNRLGGALAYGHPYAASGAMIMLHLLQSLEKIGDLGVTSIAAAGGLGLALLVEKV